MPFNLGDKEFGRKNTDKKKDSVAHQNIEEDERTGHRDSKGYSANLMAQNKLKGKLGDNVQDDYDFNDDVNLSHRRNNSRQNLKMDQNAPVEMVPKMKSDVPLSQRKNDDSILRKSSLQKPGNKLASDRSKSVRFKNERVADSNDIDIEMLDQSDSEGQDKSVPNRSEEIGDVSIKSDRDQRHGLGNGYFESKDKSYDIKTNSSRDRDERSQRHLQNQMVAKSGDKDQKLDVKSEDNADKFMESVDSSSSEEPEKT